MASCNTCGNGLVYTNDEHWCLRCEFPDIVPEHKQIFVEECRQSNPNASEALGVHHDTIPEFMAEDRKRGVPVNYDKEGRPLFESRQHKARYLRAYGKHNRDGGYSD